MGNPGQVRQGIAGKFDRIMWLRRGTLGSGTRLQGGQNAVFSLAGGGGTGFRAMPRRKGSPHNRLSRI